MNLYTRRLLINRFNLAVSLLTMLFGLFWLGWILFTLFKAGFGGLSAKLFLEMTPPPGSDGGLLNAIMGSLLMGAAGTALGTPVGIMAGIYLAEFGSRGWLAPATRFISDILLSAPSIVVGLFIYEAYVVRVGHFSGWAGAFALALIVVPVVIRTTENMLRLVPDSLREAAAALGAPQWKVIVLVTVRAAKAASSPVSCSQLRASARDGTPSLYLPQQPVLDIQHECAHGQSSRVIFQFAMSPYEDWHKLAWAGALLITLSVLTLNVFARVFFRNRTATY